jgi:Ca2+-binding RTX toxin-like protein
VNVSLLTGFAGGGSGSHALGDVFEQIENLRGSAFGDRLNGDNRANRLEGGAGDDTLIGNGGADVFVFADGFGHDLIADFQDGTDLLDVSALAVASGGVPMAIMAQGADAVLSDGAGNSITLTGMAGQIDLADMLV